MGFELEEDHYHLFFEDPKLEGLEVVMARMPLAEALALDKARDLRRRAASIQDYEKSLTEISDILGEHLVSWNLEKKGLPVACDAKGLLGQDERIMGAIEAAYIQAVSGVPAPLALGSSGTGSGSSDGEPSGSDPAAALSIPMEPLSPNP